MTEKEMRAWTRKRQSKVRGKRKKQSHDFDCHSLFTWHGKRSQSALQRKAFSLDTASTL